MRLGRKQVDRHKLKAPCIHFLHNLHILYRILLLLRQGIFPAVIICQEIFQLFLPLAHQLIAKGSGADTEKSRIIGQRVKNLAVGNPPRHHNVSRRMGFWEHVFYFFTGPDIPIRHVMACHGFFPLRFQPLALADAFHNGKAQFAFHPHGNQVRHNIVTGTDCRGNGCLFLLNQRLGIPQPHIRPMGQARNPHQVRKRLGIRVNQHLDNKFRPELWDAKGSQLAAPDILRQNPKGFRTLEQGHDMFVIQRDVPGVYACQVLQHTYHGRIVVPKDIQL